MTPDGRSLVVSERVSNRLETLPLDRFGRPGAPVVTASSGAVPFGFGITRHGTIVVSEAGASTVSSYRPLDGSLRTVTASLPVGQGAACWVAVSPNGRFAYTGNAAGGISGFAVGRDGSLTALRHDRTSSRPRATSTSTRAAGSCTPSARAARSPSLPRRPRRVADARRHRARGRGHHRRRRVCNGERGRSCDKSA